MLHWLLQLQAMCAWSTCFELRTQFSLSTFANKLRSLKSYHDCISLSISSRLAATAVSKVDFM